MDYIKGVLLLIYQPEICSLVMIQIDQNFSPFSVFRKIKSLKLYMFSHCGKHTFIL